MTRHKAIMNTDNQNILKGNYKFKKKKKTSKIILYISFSFFFFYNTHFKQNLLKKFIKKYIFKKKKSNAMDKKNCMIQQIISRNQTNRYSANTKIRFCFFKYIYIYIYL